MKTSVNNQTKQGKTHPNASTGEISKLKKNTNYNACKYILW